LKNLNLRQQKFVQYYLETGNAKQSYIDAGYKARGNSAEVNSARLLRNAQISEKIHMEKEKISNELRQKFIKDALLARNVMVNILNDPFATDKDKLVAAKEVLDRAGFKQTKKTEVSGNEKVDMHVIFVEPK